MIARTAQVCWHPLLVLLCWSLLSPPAWADIVPDNTLPNPSEVASFGRNEFVIDGGTLSGHNLFHSFESFSIPAEGKALFESSGKSVERIISRVTGDLPSSIEGLVEANSEVDLIFANPNGIFLGPNARLDIGGSFISTTAETVEFEDGLDFSAVDPAVDPLLSVQIPVGLQFGASSGAIQV